MTNLILKLLGRLLHRMLPIHRESWAIAGGNYLAGLILSAIGFDAALGAQNPHTVFWIRAMLAAIPVGGLLLTIRPFFVLHRNEEDIRDEIRSLSESRRVNLESTQRWRSKDWNNRSRKPL